MIDSILDILVIYADLWISTACIMLIGHEINKKYR